MEAKGNTLVASEVSKEVPAKTDVSSLRKVCQDVNPAGPRSQGLERSVIEADNKVWSTKE